MTIKEATEETQVNQEANQESEGKVEGETQQPEAKVSDETNPDGTEKSAETETKEPGKPDKETVEQPVMNKATLDMIQRQAQRIAGKATQTLQTKVDELIRERDELKRNSQVRADDEDLKILKDADDEELGEDTAKKRDEARRRLSQRYNSVPEREEKVKQGEERLSFIERHQQAREAAYKLIFPEDENFGKELGAIVKRLEEAKDPDDFNLILENVTLERKVNAPPKKVFKPAEITHTNQGVHTTANPRSQIEEGLAELTRKK